MIVKAPEWRKCLGSISSPFGSPRGRRISMMPDAQNGWKSSRRPTRLLSITQGPPYAFPNVTRLQCCNLMTRGLGRYWFSPCSESFPFRLLPCRDGTVVRALPSHQCGPGSIPRLGRHMWVEFVGSLLCTERFFSGYSGFPLSSKTNI